MITLLSDFGHDLNAGSSLQNVSEKLTEFPNNVQLNLVKYPLAISEKSVNKPEKLLMIIKQQFRNAFINELDVIAFEKQLGDTAKLNKLKEYVTPTYLSTQEIYMVYPDALINGGRNTYASVKLNMPSEAGHHGYDMTYTHYGPGASVLEYTIPSLRTKRQLFPSDQASVFMTGDESLNLSMDVTKRPGTFSTSYLEIYSHELNKKTRFNISFVEKASLTMARLQFLSASVAMLSLICFLALLASCHT